jgi:hypothetical protein
MARLFQCPLSRRRLAVLASFGFLLLAAVFLLRDAGRPPKRTYRMGVDDAPPYYSIRPDGTIQGLAFDVLNEAARRAGIVLEWVHVHEAPDSVLRA